MKLITTSQYKLDKSIEYGYKTAGLALAPANEAAHVLNDLSLPTMCAYAGECTSVCLSKTGMNKWPKSVLARANRTQLYIKHQTEFFDQLIKEVRIEWEKAMAKGLAFAFRPNLLSDQPKIARYLIDHLPSIQCYDYTKIPKPWNRNSPCYHLTMSYSEHMTPKDAKECLEHGVNVAMVFPIKKGHPLPYAIRLDGTEYPILDGDTHDLRFLDPLNVVVGLRFKGSTKGLPMAMNFVQKDY